MSLHIRLVEIERYFPNVQNNTDVQRAFGPLRRFCREQPDTAFTMAPWSEPDRGEAAIVIIGTDRGQVDAATQRLEDWMEANLEGQSLRLETSWL